jgi:hypothetical protein
MRVLWHQHAWVYVLLVMAGIGLGAVRVSSYQAAAAFSANGVEVVGEITHMNDYTSSNRKTFNVSYTFATTGDPYNSGNQRVSEPFYETLTDGGTISVWYLPSDPSVNVVDLDKLESGFWLSMMAALGLILAGGVGGALAVLRARASQIRSGQRS